ncbi:hypothetical protein BDN70DRAFT_58726 [Pholiota conissans]|uniref:F-box domain-containing protein n=1 Tax=Pholiota conissans TaxID=109636 RepID=A0A9P5YZ21_9AGAR|nr:hypothetical protein BDN70DRAFT_58726 [Pholiota conissans]
MLDLPYELIELIIDIVAHSDDPNLSSTKACSLVCHDILCHCRKHSIFASITLASRPTRRPYYYAKSLSAARTKTTTVVDLHRLLDSSPDIGALIRNLGCCIQLDLTDSHKSLIFPTFKKISHLQSRYLARPDFPME